MMNNVKGSPLEPGTFKALQIGAEGGEFVVYGRSCEPLFDRNDDLDGYLRWGAALECLDQYPWAVLHPLFVHPAVEPFVLQAVNARTSDTRTLRKWTDVAARSRQMPEAQTAAIGVTPGAGPGVEHLRFRVVLESMGYPDED